MILECEFFKNGRYYHCSVKKNQEILESVMEIELKENQSVENVTQISFRECYFPKFQKFNNNFVNLEKLSITFSKLKSISKHDLQPFTNLKIINLDNNDLEFIPGDLFEFTPKMKSISFWRNKIKFIGENLLEYASNLEFINFSENLNIDCRFDNFYKKIGKDSLNKLNRIIRENCKPPKELLNEPEKIQNLFEEFQNHLKREEFKDFTIKIGESEFKIHKIVFAARSETFAELLRKNPKMENFELEDISIETFESIIKFIYTDELKEEENIEEIFAAAGKLKIKSLKTLAGNFLISKIQNEESLPKLLDLLVLSNKCEHLELRSKVFQKVQKQFNGKFNENFEVETETL